MKPGKIYNYEYVHVLLRNTRGRAREYDCVDCDGPAAHWSLSAYAEDILYQEGTSDDGKAFSQNLEDYEPRCRKCHSAYDKKHDLMRGPQGNHTGRNAAVLRGVILVCQVDGCNKPHKARGKCDTHYRQEWKAEKRENNGL